MILDAFTLAGKVAMVTGCDTGLGQEHGHCPRPSRMRYRGGKPQGS